MYYYLTTMIHELRAQIICIVIYCLNSLKTTSLHILLMRKPINITMYYHLTTMIHSSEHGGIKSVWTSIISGAHAHYAMTITQYNHMQAEPALQLPTWLSEERCVFLTVTTRKAVSGGLLP